MRKINYLNPFHDLTELKTVLSSQTQMNHIAFSK